VDRPQAAGNEPVRRPGGELRPPVVRHPVVRFRRRAPARPIGGRPGVAKRYGVPGHLGRLRRPGVHRHPDRRGRLHGAPDEFRRRHPGQLRRPERVHPRLLLRRLDRRGRDRPGRRGPGHGQAARGGRRRREHRRGATQRRQRGIALQQPAGLLPPGRRGPVRDRPGFHRRRPAGRAGKPDPVGRGSDPGNVPGRGRGGGLRHPGRARPQQRLESDQFRRGHTQRSVGHPDHLHRDRKPARGHKQGHLHDQRRRRSGPHRRRQRRRRSSVGGAARTGSSAPTR
jgi:hypothetical protein